jgi:hypothetical protein
VTAVVTLNGAEEPSDDIWVVNIHRMGPGSFVVDTGEGETSLVDRATLDQMLTRFIGGKHE